MNKSTISKQRSYLTDLFSTLAVKSRRRSTLWLMLFTLLLLPTSLVAQTDYDTSVTFSALAGKPEGFDNEKYTNLFDGLKDPSNSTKWCGKFVSNGGTYVIFEASKAGIPVGYTITTGNDNSAYKGRNPRSWKLYGNNEGKNGAWTLIQEVSYDTKLQDVNCASYDFTCEGSTPYKYFKWEITGIKNKDYIQVGEFELKLNTGYQVYAEFDEGTGTLTFKYGPSTSKPEGAYKLNVGPYRPGWHAQKEKIKTVVFDASFAIARPTTCNTWFSGCKNLTDIKGIENLNTEKVTSMIYMFDGCSALTSLDVSNFNTAEVKSMTYMFNKCSTLTSLNLSNFNTAKVTDMSSMFEDCTKLASLDLSNFNTEKVMYMSNMFYNCSALTSLDLRKFNTAKVTEMSNMFYNCSALTTIFASDKFVTDLVTKSTDMFSGCKNLIGAIGYDETNTNNKDYANLVDGYFTPEGGFHAYAEFDEGTGTLTFRRGVSKPEGAYELNEGRSNPKWYDKREKINKVVFDASFASARPTSCYYWFTGCSNLTTIEGIEYLNTEKVTDMICMFFHCSSLTSLDLSNFNTANVTDMGYMFNGCSALTTIFVSDKFVTDLVTKSTDMFSDCKNLIGAIKYDGSKTNNKDYANMVTGYFTPKGGFPGYAKFDEGTGTLTFTSGPSKPEGAYDLNVGIYYPGWWPGQRGKIKTVVFDASFANARPTSCYCWFSGCNNLTEIKGIEYLNTENVTNMGFMFNSCKVLTSLNLSNFNTEKVTDMQGMFGECWDLTSLDLTSFNTEKVTNMNSMFFNCSDLTSLNLSNFNTEKVMYMSNMFYNCSALTSLDLRKFNTAKVTEMSNMFYNCSALTTIFASDKFVTDLVTKSTDMFSGCKNLIGAIGYDETNTNNKDYANLVDGYFTPEGGFHAYAEFDEGTGTLTFRRGVSKPEGAYELNEGRSNPKWYDKREKINKVVFDASFASARPTSCYYWFTGCSNLTTIEGIEYLNTEKVTDMICMFFHCSSLTSLDLSNFNTANVTDMGYMFNGCSALTTIFVSDKFVTDLVTKSTDMFSDCKNLIGAIKYDGSKTNNKDYANMVTGYFTPKGGFPGYAKFDEGTGTLTFTSGPSKPEGAYDLNVGIYYPGWWPGQRGKIKTVVFDASFANARPTSCYCWFSGCNNLTEIKGIEYLNTENVTNMGFMFNSCKVLTSLNLSNFNTEKVTDMQGMFGECWDLTSLDLTSFNTEKVTNMRQMFFNCSDLTSLNLSKFNTEKVMYMSNMFYNCNKLTSLDLTSFNTAEVTKMDYMFESCSALTSLDLSNFNTAKVTDMKYMFYCCDALKSLDITSFNTAEVTDMSSMFRSCFALTSLDLSNFNTAKVTNMSDMFRLCKALTSLDLSNFNTAKVENMGWMFKSCYALTSLDLSSFNTANVKDMTQMFYESNALTTIYASDNFVTGKDTKSVNMFKFCSSLKDYNDINIDCTYANYKTGYFSKLVGKNGDEKIGATGETLATENLALDDEKNFVAYEPFAAKTASYSRTMNAGTTWGRSVCLSRYRSMVRTSVPSSCFRLMRVQKL